MILPIMTALVLSLLWRQLGSEEAVRLLNEEGVVWTGPVAVTAQAVTDRLRTLPPELFRGVLEKVLHRLRVVGGAGSPVASRRGVGQAALL